MEVHQYSKKTENDTKKITLTIYNADDEFPDCMECDFCCCANVYKDHNGKYHDRCCEECGAENGWNLYRRTEYEES